MPALKTACSSSSCHSSKCRSISVPAACSLLKGTLKSCLESTCSSSDRSDSCSAKRARSYEMQPRRVPVAGVVVGQPHYLPACRAADRAVFIDSGSWPHDRSGDGPPRLRTSASRLHRWFEPSIAFRSLSLGAKMTMPLDCEGHIVNAGAPPQCCNASL